MNKRKLSFLATALISVMVINANGQSTGTKSDTTKEVYPIAKVSYDDYKNLVSEVEAHRAKRLLSLDTFLHMSQDESTIILDTRSKFRYDRIHIKGAKHLAFTEFTQSNLNRLIGDKNTRILIYCNNNFSGNKKDFASKRGKVVISGEAREFRRNGTSVMLALNIPTYLNLYGYGFQNVYELHEYVNVEDDRIEFEGTAARKARLVHLPEITVRDSRLKEIRND